VTVDVRSLVKLEAGATAFRLVVTVAAGLLGLAILAGVTETLVYASAALLLVVAVVGPIVHGWLAVVLRDGRSWALEATLIATVVLALLDAATVITMHVQNAFGDTVWPYVTAAVLVGIVHLVILVQATRLYVGRKAEETTEPETDAESSDTI
jgi:hypothetical protein